jgi:hypothetical protein
MRRTPVLAAVVLGAALLLALLLVPLPAGFTPRLSADAPSEVVVTNFPEIQKVAGKVSVAEPVPHSALVRRLDVVVPPVPRSATTGLVEAGTVDAAGFTHAVLGLRGEVQGNLLKEGTVGAVLVPDEEPVLAALREQGRYDFPVEVRAEVLKKDRGYFASGQPRRVLGFPRYRVFLYNTSDRSVNADLYVYLTE